MEWNGDIRQVMAEDDDIGYVVPKEGCLLWEDTLAIPNGAPHPENAHAFIDFVLGAEAGAAIASFIQYATPNEAARALMPAEYTGNPAIFPPDEVIAQSEPAVRSEAHTSELQSLMRISYAVFCLQKKSTLLTTTSRSHFFQLL